MFSSTILDVIIGLVFCFASVALFVSAINEAFASFLKLRQKTLLTGLQQLLNDEDGNGLVKELYQHALINPMSLIKNSQAAGAGLPAAISAAPSAVANDVPPQVVAPKVPDWRDQHIPAYIASKDFAYALIDVIKGRPNVASLDAGIAEIQNPQLKQVLQGFFSRAGGDLDKFSNAIADWFDNAMDRLSGSYKRKAQVWTFLIGLGVAVTLNIDTLYVLARLWARPALASSIVSPAAKDLIQAAANVAQKTSAGAAARTGSEGESAGSAGVSVLALPSGASTESQKSGSATSTAAAAADAASSVPESNKLAPEDLMTTLNTLPVGWGCRDFLEWDDKNPWKVVRFYVYFLVGLLVTASSALFGAPFWFDLLQRLIQIRGTGTKPPANRDKNKADVTSKATP